MSRKLVAAAGKNRSFPPLLLIAPGLGTLLATFLVEPSMQHYMPERSQFDEGTDTWYLE